MGFQDRDYYREGSQSVYVTSMVVKLIIINAVVFLAEILFGENEFGQNAVAALLGVHADTIVRPLYWWQFLTAGFTHDPNGLTHILFNMLGLYCFGMPLEERYGRREFLRFYLIAVVLGMIVWSTSHYFSYLYGLPPERAAQVAQGITCFGASGGVTAATLLFCLLYPRATLLAAFIIPVPAWLVGGLIILVNLFGTVSTSPLMGGVAYDVHLVGAALALGYWYFGWNFGRFPGMNELKRLMNAPKKWMKPRPPLKVHDPEHYYEDLDEQADRLLDKVAHEGLSSLTDKERRILEDYSRRTRQKLR
jgi:membrane associated rhomboid family serine protease